MTLAAPKFPANDPALIAACARAAHEANRSYCLALGDTSQLPWDEAPEWQRQSSRLGVESVLAGKGPSAIHTDWLNHKREQGWTHGAVKDVDKKEHPCMVPYELLPPEQQMKDCIFVAVVGALASSLGPYKFRFDTLLRLRA